MPAPRLGQRSQDLFGLLAWAIIVLAIAATAAIASAPAPVLYAQLIKPSWAPAAWMFGPVWSVLYPVIAVAAWLVWLRRDRPGARLALWLFMIQLVLNGTWAWIFFHWQRGALSYFEMVLFWLAIAATMIAFHRVRPLAAWLLVPYLLWASYATALTYTIWQQNRGLLS